MLVRFSANFSWGAQRSSSGGQTFTISVQTWPERRRSSGVLLRFDPNVSSTLDHDREPDHQRHTRHGAGQPGRRAQDRVLDRERVGVRRRRMTPAASDGVCGWSRAVGSNIIGSAREPWAKTTVGVASNATTITLDRDPTGWQVDDEISIAPSSPNDYTGFEPRTISAINGRTISLNAATPPTVSHAHLGTQLPDGTYVMPEVLNLTRNVIIQGGRRQTPSHSTRTRRTTRVARTSSSTTTRPWCKRSTTRQFATPVPGSTTRRPDPTAVRSMCSAATGCLPRGRL